MFNLLSCALLGGTIAKIVALMAMYRNCQYFPAGKIYPEVFEELSVQVYKDKEMTDFWFSVRVVCPSSETPTFVFNTSVNRVNPAYLMTEFRNVLAFMDFRDWKKNCEHYEDIIFDLR